MIWELSIIVVCIAWGLCSAFYSGVVRPVLRDRVRYMLFAERDALRRLAIDGDVEPSSFHYMYLERILCRLIDQCYWYSFGSVREFFILHPNAKLPADAVRFEENAPDELKEISERSLNIILLAMAVNAPIFAIYLVCASRLKRKLTQQTKTYLQEPPDNVDSPRGMMAGAI